MRLDGGGSGQVKERKGNNGEGRRVTVPADDCMHPRNDGLREAARAIARKGGEESSLSLDS